MAADTVRLLITGGAGYIGGFTSRVLASRGHDLTLVDDLSAGQGITPEGATLVVADITDEGALERIFDKTKPDAVLHFAALKSVADSWRRPSMYRRVNVEGTRTLMRVMRASGASMLVYSGSCAIYGVPDEVPVDESSAPKPMNPYGESKWLAEEEIRTASAEWGLRSCILRYFNAAGAELDGSLGEKLDHSANLIPVVMRAALGLIPHVPVYGLDYDTPDGSAIRDYVHVQDLARAHLLALDYLSAGGATTAVNVGTGSGHSVLDVLAEAEQTTQRPIEIRNEGRRAGDAPAIWADTALAHQVLNWKSELELPDIIRSAWIWHSRQHGADH